MKLESYKRAQEIISSFKNLEDLKTELSRKAYYISGSAIESCLGESDYGLIKEILTCRVDAKIKSLESEFESL